MKENLKPGYKHTALGWIPEEWEVRILKEVAKVQGGFAFDSKKFLPTGRNQVIKMSNLYGGTLDLSRSASFLDTLSKQEQEFLIQPGDILLSLTGTIGKRDYGYTHMITNESNLLLNQRVARIIPIKETTCDSYIYFQFQSNRILDQFFYSARGGTGNQANVGTGDVEQVKILLPPLPEQRKIAAVLASWDKAIATQNALIAALETRHRALMQRLLAGKVRLKGFAGEWKEVRLGDVAIVTMGQSPNSTAYNSVGNGLPLLQGNADIKDRKTITRFWTTEITKECFAGDIVMSVRAPVGTIGIAMAKSCIGRGICAIKSRPENSQKFLYFFMVNFEEKWKEFEQGSTFTAVNSNDVKNLSFTLPALPEQSAIAQILSTSESEIAGHRRQLAMLKEQKKGLMQMLLSGKKRVQV